MLDGLARRFGETAHYAVLDGHEVVYRAKVDPPTGAVRLTSTIGGRNPAHCTAVGKLLLAYRLTSLAAVEDWIGDRPLIRRTPGTLCTAPDLRALVEIREQGFAVDDQENEVGVNCVAVPVFDTSPRVPSGAVSVSGLTYRMPLATLVDSIDESAVMWGSRCGDRKRR